MRALLLLLLLAACPAAHSGYPTTSCGNDDDCYRGEKCVLTGTGGTCSPDVDGGAP